MTRHFPRLAPREPPGPPVLPAPPGSSAFSDPAFSNPAFTDVAFDDPAYASFFAEYRHGRDDPAPTESKRHRANRRNRD
ncbi:MAG TPA: hypothetical protein VLJ59_05115 [Mycobacteriales bacterium]|nr:hypothetical protein [Mycobacteriales bacterium]